jgi:hypothetical protein
MTWGRQNGDAQNCAAFPPLCTYEGMQQRLRLGYLTMAQENQSACAPVGMAWRAVRGSHPDITLYNADGSHPSLEGSYLAAATIFCTLFRRTAEDLPFTADLPGATATILRQVASNTVLDSISTWNIGILDPVAAFEAEALQGSTFRFSATEVLPAATFWWDLGDGNTANGEEVEHSYGASGNYVVRHAVTNECGRSDTTALAIDVVGTSVNDLFPGRVGSNWFFDGHGLRTNDPTMSTGTLHVYWPDGRTYDVQRVTHGRAFVAEDRRSAAAILLWRWSDAKGNQASGRLFMPGAAGR